MAVNGASFKLSENELRVMNIDHILTKKQISEKEKCLAKGQGMTLTLSVAQMKKLVKEKKHVGGFIFTIPAILAAIGCNRKCCWWLLLLLLKPFQTFTKIRANLKKWNDTT